MPSPADYKRQAAECLSQAEHVINPQTRSFLRVAAAAWSRLADQADKNRHSDLVYETPEWAATRHKRSA